MCDTTAQVHPSTAIAENRIHDGELEIDKARHETWPLICERQALLYVLHFIALPSPQTTQTSNVESRVTNTREANLAARAIGWRSFGHEALGGGCHSPRIAIEHWLHGNIKECSLASRRP